MGSKQLLKKLYQNTKEILESNGFVCLCIYIMGIITGIVLVLLWLN